MLSSISYSFPSIGLLPPCLDLFLDIFDAIVHGIVFLTSLSDSLLLVYRKVTDFSIFILYPETLLNSLMSSNSFLVVSLGLSIYSIMSSANSDSKFLYIYSPQFTEQLYDLS